MNPFDEWHAFEAFAGTLNNKTGTLSDTAVVVRLTTPGWWTISADVPYHVRGPDAASTAVSTQDRHEFDRDYFICRTTDTKQYVSVVRSGTSSGNYWIGRVKGR